MIAKSDQANDCLSTTLLRDYLGGCIDEIQSDAVESHLAVCQSCEETLDELEKDGDTMVRHLRTGIIESKDAVSELDPVISDALQSSQMLIHEPVNESRFRQPAWSPSSNQIGPYELLRPIGAGGMGAVYLARHCELGKQVAIKLLPATPSNQNQHLERFLREIRTAGFLEHPSIIYATDAGRHENVHYLVMEYIDGFDLSRVARAVTVSVADACEMIRQTALGLAHAHAEGVVHRDIKPSNLMLSRNGEIKILDFGLAQMNSWDGALAELTSVGQLMGTLDYMSPEQAEQPSSVDYRADLYSLGATLFRLIGGRPPLAASPNLSPLAKLRLLADHQPPSLDTLRSDLPPSLVKLAAKMLSASPNDRPASASHVAESLTEFSSGHNLVALAKSASSKVPTETAVDQQSRFNTNTQQLPRTKKRKQRWPWFAAAFVSLALWMGVTFTLDFNKGQLIIESDVDDVSVSIVKGGASVKQMKIEPGVNSTRLFAGSYQVVIGAGSDQVTISNDKIKIQRGETTIARIHERTESTTETANSITRSDLKENPIMAAQPALNLPSLNQKLIPGQRLKLTSAADPDLEMDLTVMADHTIKPRRLGVFSIRNMTVSQAEEHLNTYYKKFYDEPAVELFVEFDTDTANSADISATKQLTTREPPASVAGSTPVYDGKTLGQWLNVIHTERHRERMDEAMDAISALATKSNSNHIIETLVANRNRLSSGDLHKVLLKTASLDTLPDFIFSQLDQGEITWQAKMLDVAVDFSRNAEIRKRLCEWILSNVLISDVSKELLDQSLNAVYSLTSNSRFEPELRDKIIQRLHDRTIADDSTISPLFWIATWPADKDKPWFRDVVFEVCKHVIIQPGSTEHELSAAIAMLRYQVTTQFDLPARMLQDEELMDAIATRFAKSERTNWDNRNKDQSTRFNLWHGLWSIPKNLLGHPKIRVEYSRSTIHTDPIIELLQLAKSISINKSIEPHLQRLLIETFDGYARVKTLVNDQNLDRVRLDWTTMTVQSVSLHKTLRSESINKTEDLPTSQDWFDAQVYTEVYELIYGKSIHSAGFQ